MITQKIVKNVELSKDIKIWQTSKAFKINIIIIVKQKKNIYACIYIYIYTSYDCK